MSRLRLGRVTLFLALTFGLSWGFDLAVEIGIGKAGVLDLNMSPPGMFFPAFVAAVLRLWVFRDSPIHYRRHEGEPSSILTGFLFLTVVYGLITVLASTTSGAGGLLPGLGAVVITLWTLWLFFVHSRSGEAAFERAGLRLGNLDLGFKCVLGVVSFLVLQAALNLALGLGRLQGASERIYGVPIPEGIYPVAGVAFFVAVAVIGTPLTGLAVTFGEEYGWRGFLQDELTRIGRRRGVLLVGLIWGLWHLPVILSGVHTYPASWLGLILALIFFPLWGFVQSYAVLKTGSIWVAAFLHGVVNSVYSFLLTYFVRPFDKVFSFGLGIYGLACLALVVLFILRDPIWRQDPSSGRAAALPPVDSRL